MNADGEVYQVRCAYREAELAYSHVDPNWYEYRVWLLNDQGDVVAEWDSLYETYNGCQILTRAEARRALNRIKREINIEGVDPNYWFEIRA